MYEKPRFLRVLLHDRGLIESEAAFEQSKVAPKLIFRADAEHGGPPLKLKVEINTRETDTFDEPLVIAHSVANPWFTGEAQIPTYSREEMLGAKLRALLQRDKGRDLLDLSHALGVLDRLDLDRIVAIPGLCLEPQELTLARAQAEERMFAKLANPGSLSDIKPLLSAKEAERLTEEALDAAAFVAVLTQLLRKSKKELLAGEQL